MIFCVRVCGRKYFRLFSGYFIINFSPMYLRDQIFIVLLEHFISENVRKWQRDQMFYVILFISSVTNFVSKWPREQLFSDFISLILCKSCCGSNCYIFFSVFYYWFGAQMTARALMISRVTESGSGMCGVLLSFFFINFAQVTAGVGVFLRSFFFSIDSFFLFFPILLTTNLRWLEF